MGNALRIATVIFVLGGAAANAQQTPGLVDLSIQDLMNIEVTSVSRKAQEVVRTAAAVYVITREDIRRSGATNLPDVLRMAPGFSVAELNANTWSVTARGFGGVHANKLLVLIDGRSIYTPLNGGVSWEMQLLPLDAIEQIEVIRGPGGSLWGANAINGVINIITKTADRTEGGQLETHVGRYEPGNAEFSYGGKMGSTGHYVTRAGYFQRHAPGLVAGFTNSDDVRAFHGRARLDWSAGTDKFSFQADAADSDGTQVHPVLLLAPPFRTAARAPISFTSGSTAFSWKRANSSRVESSLQAYYSGFVRSELNQRSHTVDIDARQHRAVGERHDVVAGAGYRWTEDTVTSSPTIALVPHFDGRLATAFVQDEIAITDRVRVTGGAKVERNQDTGFEVQPSARALWIMSSRQSVWGAVSRAVRTPNRFERGMHIITSAAPGPGGLPLVVTLQGSTDTVSESLTEYEAGYRAQRTTYSVDLTGFAGRYTDLSSLERGTPGIAREMGATVFRVPLTSGNSGSASTEGIEVAGTWKPAGWWQVSSNYSFTGVEFRSRSTNGSAAAVPINGPVPQHQFHVRSFMDLPRGIEASALFYRASPVPDISISGFKRLDLQMTWAPSQRVRLTGGVRSLLHDATAEYADITARVLTAPVRANPYVEIRWWF